jgi:hypothetical protein
MNPNIPNNDYSTDGERPSSGFHIATPDEYEYALLNDIDDAINEMQRAMQDAAAAKMEARRLSIEMQIMVAKHQLAAAPNARTRKALLTLALADDARYQARLGLLHATKMQAAEAETRAAVAREQAQTFRAELMQMRPTS